MAWPKDTERKKTSKARGKFTPKFDLKKKKKKKERLLIPLQKKALVLK